jgi:HSP20 family protein
MKTVVRWDPFRELELMERSMRRFGMPAMPVVGLPAADVYETADEYVVELEVPGYDEKELSIEVFDHTVAIKGTQEKTTEEKTKEFALHERLERQFERRFTFPREADTEHLKAVFEKGVLEVHAQKLQTAMPKKVEIAKA